MSGLMRESVVAARDEEEGRSLYLLAFGIGGAIDWLLRI